MKNTCKVCDKPISNRRKFCSQDCFHRYMVGNNHPTYKNDKITKDCEICGKEFTTTKRLIKKGSGKYCSWICVYKANSNRKGNDNPTYQPDKHILCKCIVCEKEFIKRKWAIENKGEGKYCSRVCAGIYRSKNYIGEKAANWRDAKINKSCEQCGAELSTTKYKLKNGRGRFCSRMCQDAYKSIHWVGEKSGNWKGGPIEIRCPICGKVFTAPKSKGGKVCSKECVRIWLSQNYSGENSAGWLNIEKNYPAEWNAFLKQRIRERDNFVCQICSKPQNGKRHDVHHIDYDKKNISENNLITLCHSCHTKTNCNRKQWVVFFNARSVAA